MYCKYCNQYMRSDAWKVPEKPKGFIHKKCADKAQIPWTVAIRRTKFGDERITRKSKNPETIEMFDDKANKR